MDVGAWLRGLALGQYAGTFRESEIEADVLPELTEIDLEKLGSAIGAGAQRNATYHQPCPASQSTP